MSDDRFAILGGGIAGLSAAARLREHGLDVPVFEAKDRPGGLLDSFTLETAEGRWTFDNAVHLSFASEPEVRAVFDRTPYLSHEARSLNWDGGLWIPHPVQNNMFPLPAEEKADLIVDLSRHLAQVHADAPIATYRDWLLHQYGEKIAERWPLRYTRKYWTLDAGDLGIGWIGNRMRRADLREVVFGAVSDNPPNTYYVSTMRYPERGGYRAFLDPLLEAADIRCGLRAVEVDNRRNVVTFADGRSRPYRRMISTIPLPVLVALMTDVPDDIRRLADTLFATSIDIVSIGFRKPNVSPSLWFYIYDTDILASRAYSPSIKSAHNAPEGCSSLQFEIYSSRASGHGLAPDGLVESCIRAVEAMGLAGREEIALTHHKHLPFGNVVFDLGMEERRDVVRGWVESQDILLAGRFGEWDYLWSNQAFMSGRAAADALAQAAR
ncbi:protoporphyrinogen/coproporphyrinogen oxidase [Shinella sp. BYT-45]|uniref:protoporphyrinogen/coproporphyrinogen oxidase n=1 Tax=Shinella sp. BYT-45 TaxID=3377377 RepID=UPI0039808C05